MALQSIGKIHQLATEATVNVQKQAICVAQHGNLERSVNLFTSEQQNVLSSLVGLDKADEFVSKDSEITVKMEQLYGEIQVMFITINVTPKSYYNKMTDRGILVSARMFTLPKIELPQFDGNLINW